MWNINSIPIGPACFTWQYLTISVPHLGQASYEWLAVPTCERGLTLKGYGQSDQAACLGS